jgi:hypothetical protein
MNQEPLKAEDLGLINRLIKQQPELQELVQIVKQVTSKLKFPIESFDDMAEALGPDAAITFRGRKQLLTGVRDYVPAYYFPIGSERDLVAKLRDLAKGAPASYQAAETGFEAALKFMPAMEKRPENVRVPEIANEEVLRISGFGKQTSGIGGLGTR